MKKRIIKKIIRTLGEGRRTRLTCVPMSTFGGIDGSLKVINIIEQMPWVKRKHIDRYEAYLRYCYQHSLHHCTFGQYMIRQRKVAHWKEIITKHIN